MMDRASPDAIDPVITAAKTGNDYSTLQFTRRGAQQRSRIEGLHRKTVEEKASDSQASSCEGFGTYGR
jgi:hypothetical protein